VSLIDFVGAPELPQDIKVRIIQIHRIANKVRFIGLFSGVLVSSRIADKRAQINPERPLSLVAFPAVGKCCTLDARKVT
jgi:hypothetical protein